ncbi:MAG TPA: 4Fe-4S dicluster domain-containing protein [candidate division Zixibacteria bacterium]|nr:4Fe-4S dicluster domain-containing protein [candidate division Zixibacteria bacterium]
MRYGFLIDQNRCIGCHACTVACKEEHAIPLGVNRTWVKYVEKGRYPDTRRHFAVLRCNHCDDAPCIEICPTVALFRRPDGIVDFDGERCIGCKSCMQACPYDALYIDPERNTAAKCNFDASRIEMGYKPACEAVCPTQAILSGDLDDPASAISRRIATEKVAVRKPEKGTRPKLYYVGVDGDLLEPSRMAPQEGYLWGEKNPGEDLYALRAAGAGAAPVETSREVYDVPHATPWGAKISAYLWSKSVAAGVLLVSALLANAGLQPDAPVLALVSPGIALVFLALTLGLLIADLKKPARFFYILTRPNRSSWLVLGGYVLAAYAAAAVVWAAYGFRRGFAPPAVFWPAAVLAVAAACYSAFLFAQARGRDFWQSPLKFWHLLAQALVAGSAALILAGASQLVVPLPLMGGAAFHWLGNALVVSLLAALAIAFVDLLMDHGGEGTRRAADLLVKGALWKPFWLVVVAAGGLLPIALTLWPTASPLPNIVAAVLALVGVWSYEHLWIKAGQAMPLS